MNDSRVTKKMSAEAMRQVLNRMIEMGTVENENRSVSVLFGFAWGDQFGDWKNQETTWKGVGELVERAEKGGYGKLGQDDLHIYVAVDEFTLCHHSDIHFPLHPSSPASENICRYLESLSEPLNQT